MHVHRHRTRHRRPRRVRCGSPRSSAPRTGPASTSAARSPSAAAPHRLLSQRSKYPSPSSTRQDPPPSAPVAPAAGVVVYPWPAWPCRSSRPSSRSSPAPRRRSRSGDGWVYEPKWDGFRTLAFVDGGDVYLQSRSGKPMTRYFPELAFPEGRYVLDGEVVLFDEQGRQDFDALGQRIHPAESRIRMLAEQTPTRFIAFDLLALDDEVLLELPAGRAPRPARAARREARRPHARDGGPRRGPAVAAGRRGRDRQAPGRALPARASARAWRRSSACARSTRS